MFTRSLLVSQPSIKWISNHEQLINSIDLLPITCGTILSSSPCGKDSTNSQINPRTTDENKNSKVHTIKIV